MTSQAHPLCTGSVSRVALFAAFSIYWQIFFWKSNMTLHGYSFYAKGSAFFNLGNSAQ
jgi:hypothetical protein